MLASVLCVRARANKASGDWISWLRQSQHNIRLLLINTIIYTAWVETFLYSLKTQSESAEFAGAEPMRASRLTQHLWPWLRNIFLAVKATHFELLLWKPRHPMAERESNGGPIHKPSWHFSVWSWDAKCRRNNWSHLFISKSNTN